MSAHMVKAVCFASSFRLSGERGGVESPNISHALRQDGTATMCGRTGRATVEGEVPADGIDCRRCVKRAEGGAA